MPNSRDKGKSAEREVVNLLNEWHAKIRPDIPAPFSRNLQQTAEGGCDIRCPYPIAIEVKRCETLSLDKWWAQAVAQAKQLDTAHPAVASEGGHMPILIYRQSRQPWRVMMPVRLPLSLKLNVDSGTSATGIISMNDFHVWLQEWVMVYK